MSENELSGRGRIVIHIPDTSRTVARTRSQQVGRWVPRADKYFRFVASENGGFASRDLDATLIFSTFRRVGFKKQKLKN